MEPDCAPTDLGIASPGVLDGLVLDWLLADADGTDTVEGLTLSPRAAGVGGWERAALPGHEQQPVPGSSWLESPPQPASNMRVLQEEAQRLWDERIKSLPAPAPAKSNSWQRRKRELNQLRDEVERLERELHALQSGESASPASEDERRRNQRHHQYIEIAWKLAAQREETLKNASINENKRLKDLVERHTKLSQALQPALFQQEACDFLSLPQQAQLQSTVERASLFRALEGKLSARLPLVEEVIRHTVLQSTRPPDMFEMQVNGGETGHPVGNIQRAKTFPFGVLSMMEVIQRSAENGFGALAPNSSVSTTRLSADAITVEGIVEVPHGASNIRFHGQVLIKRWREASHELLQFACVTRWLSGSRTNSMTEEFSWAVTRTSAGDRLLGGSSHVQTAMEVSVLSPGDERDTSAHAHRELIADTVLPSYNHLMGRMEQLLENSLLDNARAQR